MRIHLFVLTVLACILLTNAPIHAGNIPVFTAWEQGLLVPLSITPDKLGAFRGDARISWDANYLYVQVSVTDPTMNGKVQVNRDFSSVDHVVIFIDPRGTGKAEKRNKPGPNDYVFLIAPSNAFGDPMITTHAFGGHEHLSLDLRAIPFDVIKNQQGYTTRVRLPWTLLGVKPAKNQEIGLNIAARDVLDGKLASELSSTKAVPPHNPSQWQLYQLVP